MQISTDGLTRLDTFDAEITKPEGGYWYGPSYRHPPPTLRRAGIAEIKAYDAAGNEYGVQKLIQVSSLSVYYQALNGEATVWLNDTQTGKSVSGAEISLKAGANAASAKTDAAGVASLSYAQTDAPRAELRATAGGRTFVELVTIDGAVDNETAGDYYTYIYLDRELYQPTDTVHYWGVILPRNGSRVPTGLQVTASSVGEPRDIGMVEVSPKACLPARIPLRATFPAIRRSPSSRATKRSARPPTPLWSTLSPLTCLKRRLTKNITARARR